MSAHNPFCVSAARYWARGLSVVPVEPGTKKPAAGIGSWNGYCSNLPPESKRSDWLDRFGHHNIGLLTNTDLGGGFYIGAVDIDRDELVRVAASILGTPVSGKRGKKGATFFVRVERAEKLSKTNLIDYEKKPVGDILIGNSHTVIPPSIHPETGVAYEWIGKPLLECEWNELPLLDKRRLRILKFVVSSEFTPALLSGEGTHEAGLRLVAQLVSLCSDDEIKGIVDSLLPPGYAGNSLKELPGWIESARAKGFEQASDDNPDETLSAKVLRIAADAGAELFHDGENAFASIPAGSGVLTYSINSSGFQQWLRHQTYDKLERSVSGGTLRDVIATLEADALFRGKRYPVQIRIGGDSSNIEIDLGQPDARVVQITPNGWQVSLRGVQRFYRSSGFEPLPEPAHNGNLEALKTMLGLDEVAFRLFTAFLVNALRPTGPYFALLVEGEQGSGKSFLCHVAKMLIDPNRASKLRLPDNERDLMIHAKEYRLLVYDNASGMRPEMSDVFCTLATGGGLGVRKLYTNDELQVFSYSRPFVINGIANVARRPDLLERIIPLRLSPMPMNGRKTEGEMLAEFESIRPAVLSALYDAVSAAIRLYPVTETPPGLRMADAARWIAAAQDTLGFAPGVTIKDVIDAQDALFIERVNDEGLVIALREVLAEQMRNGEYQGYVGDLFKRFGENRDKGMPKSAQQLSSQLARLRPAMEKAGIHVEFLEKDKKGRKVRIWSSLAPDPDVLLSPSEQRRRMMGKF